ncbi:MULTISPECIES: MFS transporter [unclassified Aureimonas]|uniref:MFS transporter n=1 Tax=unclassified Aureimonas TaxID=2615206 RepID=UPI0006FAE0E0|nr:MULTISPECIES: MFS transporter [unclassified Aureimonas]KQT62578.1 transcriptional regulator [Aureimonas sp. Leaf427]KQT73197.1 transcriptional regulator [Aureimonas sp. Leaf460]
MSIAIQTEVPASAAGPAAWGAVLSMSLGVVVLIASEFLPVSLLTPIAETLRITEGQAGQAISISGVFAVLTSLFSSSLVTRFDRRTVTLFFTSLLIVSGAIVALAPTYMVMMAGRALLGVAIGGFWSMSTATVMRLVPSDAVPKALAMLNGGNALAATVAAPLGSFLGSIIGWRGAFFAVVPLAVIALVWQLLSMPSIPPEPEAKPAGKVFRLLRNPAVAYGMAAIFLLFMGQFALFTYLRPFLETVTRVDISVLSLLLLVIGVAGLAGTSVIGGILNSRLFSVLILIPLGMAAIAVALVLLGASTIATAILLGLWGLISVPAPVGWGTWLSRTVPEDADAGGGLMVAVIQLAITLGATAGGMLFDYSGYRSTFLLAAVLLSGSAGMAVMARKAGAAKAA